MKRETKPETTVVTIRLRLEEIEALDSICKLSGLNRSETFRYLLIKGKWPKSK